MVFEGNFSMNRHKYYNCSDSFGKFQFVKIRTFVLQLHKLDFGRRSHFHPSHNSRGLPMAMKDLWLLFEQELSFSDQPHRS